MAEGGKDEDSITALAQTNAGQCTSNHGIGKVLRWLVEFLCLDKMVAAKIKPAKCEVCAALRFLTTKHYSVAQISIVKFTLCMDYCNGPVVMGNECKVLKHFGILI